MIDIPAPRWPNGPTRFEQRFGNATTRVVAAIVLIPFVATAVWLGGWAFYAFVALIGTGALLEFYWLAGKKGAHPNVWIGVVTGLLLPLGFVIDTYNAGMTRFTPYSSAYSPAEVWAFQAIIVLLLAATAATMIVEMFRARGSALLNTMATITGVAYVSTFMATLVGLRCLMPIDLIVAHAARHDNPALGADAFDVARLGLYTVIALIVSIWICDSGAYYCGRAFGRRKLFERISPKKTWEGAIGGAVFAVGAMIGFKLWLLPYYTIADAVVLGLIVGVFGQLGDLAESQLKRDAGVKDSSQLIPGHGGLLDRFDSLLFVAPLAYLYIVFLRPLLG